MALIRMDGLKTPENVMKLAFGLYLILYVSEKFASGTQRQMPVIGILKILTQFGIGSVLVKVLYELGPNITSQDRKLPSQLLIMIPIIVYILQEYSDTTVSTGSEKENENAKNWASSMYIWFLMATCLILNWWFYDKNNGFGSFIVSGIGISLYFFYTIYANVSADSGATLKSFRLTDKALNFPKTLTFFATMIYFTILSMKNVVVTADAKNFTSVLYSCAFAIPLLAGSFLIGSTVSDSIFAIKRLMVTKLLNILNLLDSDWTYHDICAQKINDIITDLVSVRSSVNAPKPNDIANRLMVDDQSVLERFNLTDAIPLNLFQQLQTYLQAKNQSLDLIHFLGYYKNTDPLGSGNMIFNNPGIWSCILLGTLIIAYGGLAAYTKNIDVSKWGPILGLASLTGFLIYLGYTFRLVSHASAIRNEVYCEQYDLSGEDCDNSNKQFQEANFQLINQINIVRGGTGAVTVDGIDILDVKSGENMKTQYNVMKSYPGQTDITDSIDTMVKAYNGLKSMAIEVGLQPIADAQTIKFYSASADPISTDLNFTDVSLQDLVDILVDRRGFMQTLGTRPYVPDSNKTFASGDSNPYFSITQDPTTRNTVMMINYANKGQIFRQNVIDIFRIQESVKEMIYGFDNLGDNLATTMNPQLLRNLYGSGELDVNASSHPYIEALKTSFKAVMTSKLKLLDPKSDKFAKLTSLRCNWPSMKAFQSSGEYDIISNLPTSSMGDATILKDILMHAISPKAASRYDSTVNAYLENLLWIAKLELLNDTSSVMNEINYVENSTFVWLNVLSSLFVLVLVICLFKGLQLTFSSDSYFSDYFQSSVLGSKTSDKHNPLYLLLTLICLVYTVTSFTDLYSLEKVSLSDVILTDTTIWGGKQTTIPLVMSICSILMFVPMYFPSFENREHIYLVTFLLICMMCSPLVYLLKSGAKDNSVLVARRFNSVAVIVVFAGVCLLLISKDFDLLKKSLWKKRAIYFFVGLICLTCVSAPMMYLDIYEPQISATEFDDRIKKVNIGVYISIAVYAALYILFFVRMNRKKLFANPLPIM